MGWVKFVLARMIPGSIRTCVPNLVAQSCRKKRVQTRPGAILTLESKDDSDSDSVVSFGGVGIGVGIVVTGIGIGVGIVVIGIGVGIVVSGIGIVIRFRFHTFMYT